MNFNVETCVGQHVGTTKAFRAYKYSAWLLVELALNGRKGIARR